MYRKKIIQKNIVVAKRRASQKLKSHQLLCNETRKIKSDKNCNFPQVPPCVKINMKYLWTHYFPDKNVKTNYAKVVGNSKKIEN